MHNEIKAFIENDIRPLIQADGGEIAVASLEGQSLRLVLMGECAACTNLCGVGDWIAAQVRERFGAQIRVTFETKKRYFQDI